MSSSKPKYTAKELMAQCDPSAPMPNDLAEFESMLPVGLEIIDLPPMDSMADATHPKRKKPGAMKGKIHAPDDFDAPLPTNIQEAFEQRDGTCLSGSGALDKFAKFDKDFMSDGRGDHEQIARDKIDDQDI